MPREIEGTLEIAVVDNGEWETTVAEVRVPREECAGIAIPRRTPHCPKCLEEGWGTCPHYDADAPVLVEQGLPHMGGVARTTLEFRARITCNHPKWSEPNEP